MARLSRRPLIAIVLLAAALHGRGVARSILPAQDGLKFIRIAREFQARPWADAVRQSDQHPLYPALVSLVEPAVATVKGHGPDAWRIAAQVVSMLAALGLLVPLHGLSRTLFNARIADLATLGFVLLPGPMAVGHDTLSDALALFAFLVALRLGLTALRSGGWSPAVGCGLAAGFGFLTRPEALVVPCAVLAAGALVMVRDRAGPLRARAKMPKLAGVAVAFLAMVGGYALVKGEVSEKLALRSIASFAPKHPQASKAVRAPRQWLPEGLDDPRWDFSPKEEPRGPQGRAVGAVVRDLAFQWSEGLGWVLGLFAIWGLVRDRSIRDRIAEGGERPDAGGKGRLLIASYLLLFTAVLVRHETRMGYLSHRHAMTLVLVSLPWAAAAVDLCARRSVDLPRFSRKRARTAGIGLLVLTTSTGVWLQLKPPHPSRWGHWAAGRWLASHAVKGEAVLDTRGWAAFVSGIPSYDYWHVRQALTDARLAFVVVGDDELKAKGPRAATLRAVLAFAAEPVAEFPERQGGRGVGVRVYRFHRPESWEGLRQ